MSAPTARTSRRRRSPPAAWWVKQDITEPSNWRATQKLEAWLRAQGITGIAGVDTRSLTMRIRDGGAPTGVLAYPHDGRFDLAALRAQAAAWPGLEGMDLAKEVTCRQTYTWDETAWSWPAGFGRQTEPKHHVVAVDYGRSATSCAAWPPPAAASPWCRPRPPPTTFFDISPTECSCPTALATRPPPANTPCPCCARCWTVVCRSLASASASASGPGPGCQDLQAGTWPSWRQSAGEGPGYRQVEITSQNHASRSTLTRCRRMRK